MRFLVDAQLPPTLARWLREQGCDAQHAGELGLLDATDTVIWQQAGATGAVIVTKDEDFARRRAVVATGPAVVWVRLGNAGRLATVAWFAPLFPSILAALERGESLIELRTA